MAWQTPVTNWDSTKFYNFGDLNRVEANTDYLASLLSSWIASPVTVTTVTSRDKTSIDFYDSINRVEGNIKTLADTFYVPLGWADPVLTWASGASFDWTDANRLENNLLLFHDMLTSTIDNTPACGTTIAGIGRGSLSGVY
jgi:hypothetical protein